MNFVLFPIFSLCVRATQGGHGSFSSPSNEEFYCLDHLAEIDSIEAFDPPNSSALSAFGTTAENLAWERFAEFAQNDAFPNNYSVNDDPYDPLNSTPTYGFSNPLAYSTNTVTTTTPSVSNHSNNTTNTFPGSFDIDSMLVGEEDRVTNQAPIFDINGNNVTKDNTTRSTVPSLKRKWAFQLTNENGDQKRQRILEGPLRRNTNQQQAERTPNRQAAPQQQRIPHNFTYLEVRPSADQKVKITTIDFECFKDSKRVSIAAMFRLKPEIDAEDFSVTRRDLIIGIANSIPKTVVPIYGQHGVEFMLSGNYVPALEKAKIVCSDLILVAKSDTFWGSLVVGNRWKAWYRSQGENYQAVPKGTLVARPREFNGEMILCQSGLNPDDHDLLTQLRARGEYIIVH